ncbi:Hypothetical protein CAP_6664 [Chondromyces apiculatus DSM 436]|uniref:Uncharacterized protein n=1 Tax=Chondromyces apiculatus DSM 436 TaxID=1192034 RepID=A0A017T074_9BACT|nr:Hypothetical protein CAP_6664 [Chondromyces apiculatus DSM 436]
MYKRIPNLTDGVRRRCRLSLEQGILTAWMDSFVEGASVAR